MTDSLLVSCCPYNFSSDKAERQTESLLHEAKAMLKSAPMDVPWLVLHHDPPVVISPISRAMLGASEPLKRWLNTFRPDYVLSGHFHNAPYQSGFAQKILNTWCLNPGMMPSAPEPNRIVLDTARREAEWISFDSDSCQRREMRALVSVLSKPPVLEAFERFLPKKPPVK